MDELLSQIRDTFGESATDEPIELVGIMIYIFVFLILIAVLCVVAAKLLLKLNKKIFSSLAKKKGNSITLQFAEKTVSVMIVLVMIVLPLGGDEIAKSLLGSTAVLAAVVGFASQDVIRDMCAGLQISFYKPFDVGSRVEFEDGTCGIVEKLTLRHIEIKKMDEIRIKIPNSRANSMIVTDYSYGDIPRSVTMKFPICYDSDIDKAKSVIRRAVCSSPLTENNDTENPDDPNSRWIYFLELSDSALVMSVTVYYPQNVRTEVLRDEINTRVFKAFAENSIEIPYNYMNVIVHGKQEENPLKKHDDRSEKHDGGMFFGD